MKWSLIFLVSLSLATACIVEDQPISGGTGGDAGTGGNGGTGGIPDPCGGCSGDTPVCDEDTLQCVQCLGNGDCDATAPVCTDNKCVCTTDSECTSPELARCDTEEERCIPCTSNDQCDGVTGLPPGENVCDMEEGTGVCVDCTPDTEATTCTNMFSCDPRTKTCTRTRVGSLGVCEECVADSECGDNGVASEAFKCIPLDYQGNRFPDEAHGFCLKSVTLGGSCTNPYRTVIERPSLTDAPVDGYCGINEELTTCPATLALLADESCDPENLNSDCPQPAGLCRQLPGAVNRCTYRCESLVECATPGPSCGRGDTALNDYCGG